MDYTKEQLGFGSGSKNNRIKLNEISLDGEDGVFTYKKLAEPKLEDGNYQYEKLPVKSFEGVVLLVRRKLIMYSDVDERTYSTFEFNKNNEEISLYTSTGAEKGTAESLRAKYPLLKTLAVVYFYSPKKDEMIRLNCKGLGLQGEENKGVNYKGLFQYLSSFDEGELPSEYMTKVSMVEKEVTKGRKTKTYFAMRFEKGDVIEDNDIKSKVIENQKLALSQFGKQKDNAEKSASEPTEEVPEIKYPEEEIDIESIPFN